MTTEIETVRTVADLRARVSAWRARGGSLAMVPTMGAIHEGHMSLVRQAKGLAGHVVASIFVNPLQFGPSEDFEAYPRGEARDAALLAEAGADLLFAPGAGEMYPEGFATTVHVADITEGLCGASRPDHFDGVATVVAKLLLQCGPDVAIFGEKDYQQLLVIKRLVRDLNIPVKIVGGAIVREPDGLALSSRNAYLSAEERETAPLLYATIQQAAHALAAGHATEHALESARAALEAAGFRVDYLEARDPETLARLSGSVATARILVAAFLGKTRLIDNVPVPPRA
ncbi:pantoate--beta-alanine ligase [Methyloceanibacter methanicus]|uniref:Pantothenate synthetase n=2 Tax=Methyloceanibacter methanicus TaxID=1774968 RepID=A0A1E3VZI4_9HYPH|nr:pantoate--beta-alanine ligase [Methyloceanibacter methanicus]ODR98671.1 pantoate--beta-alanine ligase [Methyloceanibacter methanicus]